MEEVEIDYVHTVSLEEEGYTFIFMGGQLVIEWLDPDDGDEWSTLLWEDTWHPHSLPFNQDKLEEILTYLQKYSNI